MKSKSIISKHKPLYDYGTTFSTISPNVAYTIQNYVVTNLYEEFKKNKDLFSEADKKDFEAMVRDLATFKKGTNASEVSENEYNEFLENLFANVDDEDRYGEVTLKTSATFKMIGELIDVLGKFGNVSNEWAQRSKIF
jgi:hypothetical protein